MWHNMPIIAQFLAHSKNSIYALLARSANLPEGLSILLALISFFFF